MPKASLVKERSISSGYIGCGERYQITLQEEIDESGHTNFKMLVSVSAEYPGKGVPVDLSHLVELLLDSGFLVKWPIKLDKKSNRKIFR